MTAKLAPNPQQLLTDAAEPGNAWKAYYYEPDNTFSTQKTVYKDRAMQTEWTQPVTCGSDGRPENDAQVFLNGDYDRKIVNSSDGTEFTERNIGETWSAVGTDLSENLLSNASGETAGSSEPFENWTETDSGTVISRDTSDSYHGTASFLFTNSASGADYLTSDPFEISPGKDIAVDFSVKASNASAEPKIQINWLTGAQADISTSTIYDDNVGLTPTSWTLKQGFRATPPATARYAKLILVGNDNATQYTTRFDGINVRQVSVYPEEAPLKPYGLVLSRDSGDTDHDVKITAGAVKSHDFSDDILLTSDIVKRADASWAAGTGNGGAFSGWSLPSEGIFYVWLMKNSTTGHVDAGFDDSPTSPTLPSGYDVKRLIGALHTDSSNNIVNFVHKGITFLFDQELEDVSDTTLTDDTAETGTFSVPPDCIGHIAAYWLYGSGDSARLRLVMKPKGFTAETFRHQWEPTSATIQEFDIRLKVMVNEDSQAEYKIVDTSAGSITGTLNLSVVGFDMLTRDDP